MHDPDLATMKAAYRIPAAWRDLGLAGEPGNSCRSPFREERNPSFSVFGEGERWKDFASGESGDVLDFVARARQCDLAGAVAFVRERLGIVRSAAAPPRKGAAPPELRRGTDAEQAALAALRGFSREGIALASGRGLLWFCRWAGRDAWAVADARRGMVEVRRLDGEWWPEFKSLPRRKAHCFGSGKSRPVGLDESAAFPVVAFVEGAPDLVAAHHHIAAEGKAASVAVVAMLGAGVTAIASDALPAFAGKHVRFFPHADAAGLRALGPWARLVAGAGAAKVDAFDLSGIVTVDGGQGKDLADLCRIAADSYDSASGHKFREVMP